MRRGGPLPLALLGLSLAVAPPVGAQTDAEIEEAIRIFNRGKQLHQERQYREAIREYQAAIKLDNQNVFIYNSLGLAYAALREFEEALKAFNHALALNPDLSDLYNNIGMVYAEQGARDKAFEAFSRAVRSPSYTTPEKALYNLGNLYFEDGNLELAEMHFRRSVEKQPKFALGYRGLARVYMKMDQLDLAIRQFEKAIELAPEDAESLFRLAQIRQDKGEVDEARALYRRVVEIDRFSSYGRMALDRLNALKES
jgi:tetratricopeptide (TPR) repeat protein